MLKMLNQTFIEEAKKNRELNLLDEQYTDNDKEDEFYHQTK